MGGTYIYLVEKEDVYNDSIEIVYIAQRAYKNRNDAKTYISHQRDPRLWTIKKVMLYL